MVAAMTIDLMLMVIPNLVIGRSLKSHCILLLDLIFSDTLDMFCRIANFFLQSLTWCKIDLYCDDDDSDDDDGSNISCDDDSDDDGLSDDKDEIHSNDNGDWENGKFDEENIDVDDNRNDN